MTLTMTLVNANRGTIIATSDSMVNHVDNKEDTSKLEGKTIAVSQDLKKTSVITDFVLSNSGGLVQLTDLYEHRLKEKVNPDMYLDEVKEIARDILREFRNTDPSKNHWFKYLNDVHGLNFNLAGFYKNGSAGFITMNYKYWDEKESFNHWAGTIIAPTVRDTQNILAQQLDEWTDGNKKASEIFEEMWGIHQTIHKLTPDKVSKDMHINFYKKVEFEDSFVALPLKFVVSNVLEAEEASKIYHFIARLESLSNDELLQALKKGD